MGYLFAIEGIDGSGKQTQVDLLYNRLTAEGRNPLRLSFPDYESDSSALVKLYLQGAFGQNANDVDPKVASACYALDRYASYKMHWQTEYEHGRVILADRYTPSNMIHQAAKIADSRQRAAYLRWITDFEYQVCKIPEPRSVIFLDMPPEYSSRLTADRKNKATGQQQKDIHESNRRYLLQCYEMAKELACKYNWNVISCVVRHEIRPIQEIAQDVYQCVMQCLNSDTEQG